MTRKKRETIPAKTADKKKPVYSHMSRKRCQAPSKSYPSFLDARCDSLMRALKTRGSQKHWKCPACGNVCVTEGQEV